MTRPLLTCSGERSISCLGQSICRLIHSVILAPIAPDPVASRLSGALSGLSSDPSTVSDASSRLTLALETVNFADVALNFPLDKFITPGSLACFTAILPRVPVLLKFHRLG